MSTLISKASLLLVPSVYEDGTLYNVLPSGNKAPDETGNHNGYDQTRADFTFSRGSNLAATRVNASGLIEKGRENLLTYSKNLSSSGWTGSGCTSASAEDFEGGNNANELTSSSANGFWYQAFSSTGVNTISIYAKAGTGNVLRLRLDSSTSPQAYFDLSNGTITNQNNNIDATITAVSGADGWYRCTLTGNITSPNNVRIYPTQDTNVIVYKVQLENGLVATDYIETGSVSGTAGVLENTPRIDYSSGAGALLLESQRTNLYTHSEYYDSYTKASCTITSNATTSPEGLQNASKIVSQSGGPNIKRIQPSISTSGTNEYIISAFVKKAEWHYFFIYGAGTLVNGSLTIFNLDNGTISQGSGHATIEAFGDDGWYKITWKATSTGTGTGDPRIGITDNASSSNSTGDGVSGAYLYGLQIEQASHVSSYVPTYGSAATRGADSCLDGGNSDVFDNSNAVWFIDIERIGTDSSVIGDSLTLRDNSNVRQITLWFDAPTKQVRFRDGKNSFTTIGSSGGAISTPDNTRIKIALKIDGTTLKVFADGVQKGSNYTRPTAFDITQMDIEGKGYKIRNIQFYNNTLTDAECVTLTTL